MNRIVYDPAGIPVSDFECGRIADQFKHANNQEVFFSTENIFYVIRLSIVRGELDCGNFIFVFRGKEFQVNHYGASVNWPKGFGDFVVDCSEDILVRATEIKKKEKLIGDMKGD